MKLLIVAIIYCLPIALLNFFVLPKIGQLKSIYGNTENLTEQITSSPYKTTDPLDY